MNRLRRLTLVLVLTLAPGCASLPVKERATTSLQATQRLLGTVQDTERQLCNTTAYAAAPSAPITACVGPAADAIQLTTARHQAMARALARAFDAQIQAAVALQAWRAGDPVPAGLADILSAARETLAVVTQLVPDARVRELVSSLTAAATDVEAMIADLKGAQR